MGGFWFPWVVDKTAWGQALLKIGRAAGGQEGTAERWGGKKSATPVFLADIDANHEGHNQVHDGIISQQHTKNSKQTFEKLNRDNIERRRKNLLPRRHKVHLKRCDRREREICAKRQQGGKGAIQMAAFPAINGCIQQQLCLLKMN